MSSSTRVILVSRSNLSNWIETGLRQFREIQDGENMVALEIGPLSSNLVRIVYKVETAEPDMEVFKFGS